MAMRGGKVRRKGKNYGSDSIQFTPKDQDQEYAYCEKPLGGSRFDLVLPSGEHVIGLVCGRMQKYKNRPNNRVVKGCYVLIGIRNFQTKTCDIISSYPEADNKRIKPFFRNAGIETNDTSSASIIFEEDDIEDEDEDGISGVAGGAAPVKFKPKEKHKDHHKDKNNNNSEEDTTQPVDFDAI